MSKVEEAIVLGQWSEAQLDKLIGEGAKITDPGTRIDLLSRNFLGVQYGESTLIGDPETAEVFVINLADLDCFTFLDYVEAMRRSGSYTAFRKNVRKIRYRFGRVAYRSRNHFFSDWREYNRDFVKDVTGEVGGQATQTLEKVLNVKEDGTCYLPGIVPSARLIDYIPTAAIDEALIARLNTGDYVGMYSELPGLDVSHVGIISKDGNAVYLRHASSSPANRKVVDQDFFAYMGERPGFLVLRPQRHRA